MAKIDIGLYKEIREFQWQAMYCECFDGWTGGVCTQPGNALKTTKMAMILGYTTLKEVLFESEDFWGILYD